MGMNYHCKKCGGFLKFTEEKAEIGKYFVCKCNKCEWEVRQYSNVYHCKAVVLSNEKVIDYLKRRKV